MLQPAAAEARKAKKEFRKQKRRVARENLRTLRGHSETLLEIGKWNPRVGGQRLAPPQEGMQEVQEIVIGGTTLRSANRTTTLDLITRVQHFSDLENRRHFSQVITQDAFDRMQTFTTSVNIEGEVNDRSMLARGWIRGAYHAEQNLLFTLAKKIAVGEVPDNSVIPVFGTKAPCTTCHKVLSAFEIALKRAGIGVHLVYDRRGHHDVVASEGAGVLDLSGIARVTNPKFENFQRIYGELRAEI